MTFAHYTIFKYHILFEIFFLIKKEVSVWFWFVPFFFLFDCFIYLMSWYVDPGWMLGAYQNHSFTSLLSCGKKIMEGSRMGIRRGREHSAITFTGKRDLTWGNQFSLIPVKLELEYGSES